MFCPFCGTKHDDDAKVCTNCGKPFPGSENKPEATAEEIVDSIIEEKAAAEEAAAVEVPAEEAAAVEVPAEAVPPVETPAEAPASAPEYNAPEQPAAPVPNVPVPLYKEPQTNAGSAGNAAPQAGRAVAADAAVEKKKLSPLPFILAGVGVLLIAAAVIVLLFIFNKAAMMKTFMGDKKYAMSVMTDSVKASTSYVGNGLDTAISSVELARAASEMSSNHYSGMEMTGAAVDLFGAYMSKALNTNELTVTEKFNLKTYGGFDDYIDSLNLSDEDYGRIKALGDYAYEVSFISDEDAYKARAAIIEKNSELLSAEAYYKSNGDCFVTFPSVSKKSIYIELPEHEAADEMEGSVDPKELAKFYAAVYTVYEKHMDDAIITIENGDAEVETAAFRGQIVSVKFESDELADFVEELLEEIEDFEFIEEFMDMSGTSIEDISENLVNQIDRQDMEIEMIYYVRANGEIAGETAKLSSKSAKYEMAVLSDGINLGAYAKQNKNKLFTLAAEGTSPTEGTAKLTIYTSSSNKETITINYSDLGETKLFGSTIPTGKFVIKPKFSKDDISSFLRHRLNMDSDLADKFTSAEFELEIAPASKGADITVGVKVNKFADLSLITSIREEAKSVPEPDEKNVIDPEYDTEDMDELGDQLLEALTKSKDPILGATAANSVQQSKITSADSTAAQIRNQASVFMTNADTRRMGYSGNREVINFKVENGKWTLTSTPGGTFKSALNGTTIVKTTWSGGTNKDYDFCLFMADSLRDLKNASVSLYINYGYVEGVAVVLDNTTYNKWPSASDWYNGEYKFGGGKHGLESGGVIVGTSPYLYHDN